MLGQNDGRVSRVPNNHRTVDRITQILEEVVYRPGMSFSELTRTLGAAKSTVHGFVSGLLAQGWLHESNGRFYLGPAVYGLTIASGQIRAGLVSQEDLNELHRIVKFPVFLGVAAGDSLIYISEAGSDETSSFEVRSNIRRLLLNTAGGKAILAASPSSERDALLRRQSPDQRPLVDRFFSELGDIQTSRIATNYSPNTNRFGVATALLDPKKNFAVSITAVGPAEKIRPKLKSVSKAILAAATEWSSRNDVLQPREAI